jgi:hypothetical protein
MVYFISMLRWMSRATNLCVVLLSVLKERLAASHHEEEEAHL